MLVWFSTLGLLGLWHVVQTPAVLAAVNPLHIVTLVQHHPGHVVAILGSVVLAITGAEARYADTGHFGRPAILRAWYGLVLPGLVLDYFGQGAYVLAHPADTANPFLALAPAGVLRTGL